MPTEEFPALTRTIGKFNMPTRNVVSHDQQHDQVEERERTEQAKLNALEQAARQGWTDLAAARYAEVADDRLEDFIGQLGRLAGERARTTG